jgi:hypothetical protein
MPDDFCILGNARNRGIFRDLIVGTEKGSGSDRPIPGLERESSGGPAGIPVSIADDFRRSHPIRFRDPVSTGLVTM